MELIGIPLRVTIGKALANGQVEVRLRTAEENELVDLDHLEERVRELLASAK